MTARSRTFVGLLAALAAAATVMSPAALASPADATPAPATSAGRPYQPPRACRLPPDSARLKEGFPVSAQALPARGRLRAAVIFVDFPDAPAAPRTLKAARDQLRPSIDYLDTVSRGALRVTVRQSRAWVRTPRTPRAAPTSATTPPSPRDARGRTPTQAPPSQSALARRPVTWSPSSPGVRALDGRGREVLAPFSTAKQGFEDGEAGS